MVMNKLMILITTVPTRSLADSISKLLIERKLAACVSIKEISSSYIWQEKYVQENEIELTVKSTPENLNNLTKILQENITYEVPQLIYKIFDSEINYFNWVKESVR
tara:strand:- start:46 stop:363 length:318 start_codon:yes stop_codon:yes gene_type:complete